MAPVPKLVCTVCWPLTLVTVWPKLPPGPPEEAEPAANPLPPPTKASCNTLCGKCLSSHGEPT